MNTVVVMCVPCDSGYFSFERENCRGKFSAMPFLGEGLETHRFRTKNKNKKKRTDITQNGLSATQLQQRAQTLLQQAQPKLNSRHEPKKKVMRKNNRSGRYFFPLSQSQKKQ
jgi:hypothetical protein